MIDEIIIVYIYLQILDFLFLYNHEMSLTFIISVTVDHMSLLWEHLGLQELGKIIIWSYFLACINHTQVMKSQFFSEEFSTPHIFKSKIHT